MEFRGLQPVDFELFTIPDFEDRMRSLREHLKPKLIELAADMSPQIAKATGIPTFPHVAQHLRRRVNPPVQSWVAFGRQKIGYKRWTHYRIAACETSVRVSVFIEDDADDKVPFGEYLASDAASLLTALGKTAVSWLSLSEERPTTPAEVTAEMLAELGERLQRKKLLKFEAGVLLPRKKACALTPEEFEKWALKQIKALKPLYLAGVTGGKGLR